MMKRVIAVVLSLGVLPSIAFAQSPSSESSKRLVRASWMEPIQQSQSTTPEWQREYDDAQKRRSSAMKKLLIGGAVSAGGLVVMMMSTGSYVEGNSAAMNLGVLGSIAGAGYATWGIFQYGDAREDIRALEMRRLAGKSIASIAVADNQALSFSLGRTSSLRYSVSW